VKAFRHSGKMGDIIYALPTIRALGGGTLYLHPGGGEGLSVQAAEAMLPLLRVQPYLEGASLWSGEPFDVDLDVWRRFYSPFERNLAESHLMAFDLPFEEASLQWLTIDRPAQPSGSVVFNRTGIRLGVPGFWETCYERFGREAVFVGHPNEHRAFCEQVGQIEFLPTGDLLDVAHAIAGSLLFVGNQSCPYAVAEGLKHPSILGTEPGIPDCKVRRPDCLQLLTDVDLRVVCPLTGIEDALR
jgi:hypothetical protein